MSNYRVRSIPMMLGFVALVGLASALARASAPPAANGAHKAQMQAMFSGAKGKVLKRKGFPRAVGGSKGIAAAKVVTNPFGASPVKPAVQLSSGGLLTMAKEALPAIAKKQGLDNLKLGTVVLGDGELEKNKPCIGEWVFRLENVKVSLPIRSDGINARFEPGSRLELTLSAPTAKITATARFKADFDQLGEPGPGKCLLEDVDIGVEFSATGVTANVGAVFGVEDGAPRLESVEDLSIRVKTIDLKNDVLNWLVDQGIQAAQMFPGVKCSSLEECVNQRIEDQLEDDADLEKEIVDLANGGLVAAVAMPGGTTKLDLPAAMGQGSAVALSYQSDLTGVTTKKDGSLEVGLSLKVASGTAKDACAAKLELDKSTGSAASELTAAGNKRPEASDLEVVLPVDLAGEVLVALGSQGAFCQKRTGPLAGLVAGASGTYEASLAPAGNLRVTASDKGDGAELKVKLPVSLALDVKVEGETGDTELQGILRFSATVTLQGGRLQMNLGNVSLDEFAPQAELKIAGTKVQFPTASIVNGAQEALERGLSSGPVTLMTSVTRSVAYCKVSLSSLNASKGAIRACLSVQP